MKKHSLLLGILAVSLASSHTLFAAATAEETALAKKGTAMVCASETTPDIEDLAERFNKKIAAMDTGGVSVELSQPMPFAWGGRSGICVTVKK